jgi:hypothetical protein
MQRDDGKFTIISGMIGSSGTPLGAPTSITSPSPGAASTVVTQYDAGWVTSGMYRTEQMNIPNLAADSTLNWKTSAPNVAGISAEVKTAQTQTALQTASTHDVTNGGLINPGANETWIQINFNFKRTIPGDAGIKSDVWFSNSGMSSVGWRNFINPTLVEFKINKNSDLLNLQADGNSLFRVSSNGDLYTSANGSVRTGGADLAENYTSTEDLAKGEIVSIDPLGNHSVKKSIYQNQPDVLGVVSTQPGFVAGSFTKESYPIALVGRVPVKVSTENGMVKTGDYLTASSVPGHAMRATKSGRVIGKALENLDPNKLTECPPSQFPMPDRKCGDLMMFVNLTDYQGMPIETLMAEAGSSLDVSVDSPLAALVVESSPENADQITQKISDLSAFSGFGKQAAILDFLKSIRNKGPDSTNPSEIYTDRLSAGKEVITPSIFTDLLVAKSIKAEKIEGLEFIQTGINTAEAGVAENADTARNMGLEIADLQKKLADLSLQISAPVQNAGDGSSEKMAALNLSDIKDLQTSGALEVGGPAEFQGPAVFKALAQFIEKTIFQNETEFAKTAKFEKGMEVSGYMVLDQDSAGYAVIKKGAQSVPVSFTKEYGAAPVVNASLSLQQYDNPEVRAAAEDLLLVSDVKYIVTNVTTSGFEIKMDRAADSDIPFSWQAVAVKDPKTFGAQQNGNSAVEAQSSPSTGNSAPAAGNLEYSADQPAILPPDAAAPSSSSDAGPVSATPAQDSKPPS